MAVQLTRPALLCASDMQMLTMQHHSTLAFFMQGQDEENPAQAEQQEQQPPPVAGQLSSSQPLASPFAASQADPAEKQDDAVQHPPKNAHTILAPALAPPG